MPLSPGNSRAIVSKNIREMMASGYPQRQAVAASLSNARRHPAKRGGKIPGFDAGGAPALGTLEYGQANPGGFASGTAGNMASGRNGDYSPGFWTDPTTGQNNSYDPNTYSFYQVYQPSAPATTPDNPPPTDTNTASASWHDVGLQQGDPSSPITWATPNFGAPAAAAATDNLPTNGQDAPTTPTTSTTPPAGGNDLTGTAQQTPPTTPAPPHSFPHPHPPGGPPMMGQGLFGGHMPLPPGLTNALRPPNPRNIAPGSPQMAFGGVAGVPGMNPYVHREMRPRLGPGMGRMTYGGHFMSPVPHVGALKGPTMGRGDRVNTSVHPGSYVLPAAHVAALGQGNSDAGYKILNGMFHSGPGGMPLGKMGHAGKGIGMPRLPHAAGGRTHLGAPVEIKAAHGEFVIPPEEIQRVFGNLEAGHRALDAWVMKERRAHIAELKKLPGPVKD